MSFFTSDPCRVLPVPPLSRPLPLCDPLASQQVPSGRTRRAPRGPAAMPSASVSPWRLSRPPLSVVIVSSSTFIRSTTSRCDFYGGNIDECGKSY